MKPSKIGKHDIATFLPVRSHALRERHSVERLHGIVATAMRLEPYRAALSVLSSPRASRYTAIIAAQPLTKYWVLERRPIGPVFETEAIQMGVPELGLT